MIPLKTVQGLSAEKIREMVNERDLYIWGGGELAHAVLISLNKSGISCAGFLNTQACPTIPKLFGHPVSTPEKALSQGQAVFVVIATHNFRDQASKICEAAGLVKENDYTSYLNISRPEAVIDITQAIAFGGANPEPAFSIEAADSMNLEDYTRIINKLCKDYPLLTKINIAEWGDSFLNPELPNIVRATKQKNLICSVKTHLLVTNNLDELIASEPTEINVHIRGTTNNYEQQAGLGSWEKLLLNLNTLGNRLSLTKREINVTVRYSSLMQDDPKQQQLLKRICAEFRFAFIPEDSYIMPYDRLLSVMEQQLQVENHEITQNIPWNVTKWTKIALRDADNPCLPQRIFPVINADGSTGLCHIYKAPKVAEQFLDLTKEELLNKRHNHEHCVRCQHFGLHRLDLNVLRRKFPLEYSSSLSKEAELKQEPNVSQKRCANEKAI